MTTTCIILMAHQSNDKVLRKLEKLQQEVGENNDVVLLFDNMHNLFDESYFGNFRHALFNRHTIATRYDMYSCSEKGGIVPGNCIFPILDFVTNQPHDYFWGIEYDVVFNGNWGDLFSHFNDNHSDLLSTTYGLTIEDIGGDGKFVTPHNEERFYTNTPQMSGLAPGTFVCPPKSCEPLTYANKLYHPVK